MGAAPRRQEYIPAMECQQAAKQGNDLVSPDIAGTYISNVYEHQRGQEQGDSPCGVKCRIPVYIQSHIHNEYSNASEPPFYRLRAI